MAQLRGPGADREAMGDATPVADLDPLGEHNQRAATEVARNGPATWERIRRRADDRLATIETHAHRLLDRDLTAAEVTEAAAEADALAVELGRLELPSIARLARHLGATLARDDLDPTVAVHLAATIEDIRTLLSSAIAEHMSATASRGEIVTLGPESDHTDAITWVLTSRGYLVTADGDRLACPEPPAGVIVATPTGFDQATATLLRAAAESWMVPTIVLHRSTDPRELRELANYGTTMLDLATPADVVAGELARAIVSMRSRPAAMICGEADEPAALLASHGFEILSVPGPNQLHEAMRGKHCAVVFGPGVAAHIVFDLARLIRATPATRRAPVVWLTRDDDENRREQATRLDIFAVTDLDDGLAGRLGSLLRRSAADIADEERAAEAILPWPAAQVLIDRSLVAAHRGGSSVALAAIVIGPDVAGEKVDQLEESLTREFRRGDIVASRGPRQLAVVLQGVSRRVAVNRLSDLLDRLDLLDGSGVGVAVFPNDGRSAVELATAADGARELALEHDGPAVVASTWRPDDDQAPDVLVLDPDPVLGAVIRTALVERGYRPELVPDGRELLDRLTAAGAAAVPRLVLLDLDAPGLDGLSLLRRLRTRGVLSQTNVLLMTPRFSEADVRMALELGVADILRKPFSATLLLHRVRRLMEDRA